MSGAITALIGATIGAIATVVAMVVQTTLASRADAERRREARENDQERARRELVRRYLFQLQDAVVSLQRRLDNWARRGGQAWSESVDPGYWDVTTLYALGRALAAERILSLEGVYAAIDQQFSGRAELLSSSSVDEALQAGFHQLFRYHRLALAESLLEWRPEGYRLLMYTEWRRRYEDPSFGLDRLLGPTRASLQRLSPERDLDQLIESLAKIASRLESAKSIPAIEPMSIA
jgi:hypothetical protein